MIYLDVEDLLYIAERAVGGVVAVRDLGLLEAAAARPQASAFGEVAYPSLHAQAAALLHSIVGNHALVDGNKRLGLVRGQRYPLTYTGAKSVWQRMRRKAGVVDFRFHDFRHDFGSKLLRETGNLKIAQQALNHADIKSTLRYCHVLNSDIADAV